jgi:hypothetical protein
MTSTEEIIPTAIPLEDESKEVDEPGTRIRYVGWEGSNVRSTEVDWLYNTKRIPPRLPIDFLLAR